MKKKIELGLRQNSKNLARIGLIAFLFFLFQWQSFARQDTLTSSDTVVSGEDSLGFAYHKAWTFEEGYEKSYLSSEAYSYEEIEHEKNWLQRAKLWFKTLWDKFLDKLWSGVNLSGFWKVLFQLAPYLLLLVLMILLVWLAMKYNSGKSEDQKGFLSSPNSDEVLIKSSNLKELADEALKSQDFRLALRYRYLLVLRHLIERKLILWKSSKTNHDYQKELKETSFLGPFTEVTRIYNFVWYGHLEVDAKSFKEFEKAFNHLEHLS